MIDRKIDTCMLVICTKKACQKGKSLMGAHSLSVCTDYKKEIHCLNMSVFCDTEEGMNSCQILICWFNKGSDMFKLNLPPFIFPNPWGTVGIPSYA